ncbi:hypothetical protein [Actinomadura bangladeshensis]|uniref:Uncharacterized protein n=1 Tax=Actinomadura bangladeshensis TaxID=453573 RepID=A0A6L9QC26_9ACTN|nr:hypothetical protein [Actinomadura bangladeshensis]NEA22596.1 hypothetical protein [Actinomadura bangladeshensis]
MTAALAQIPWSTLVASGIVLLLLGAVSLVVRAIVKGDLVPRSVLEREERRADKWEAACNKSEERLDAFEGRLNSLAEAAELHTQLLSSLIERARR